MLVLCSLNGQTIIVRWTVRILLCKLRAFSFQRIVLPLLRSALLAIIGHAGPRWTIRLSIHLVLGLPCRLVHSRGVHAITLLIYVLVHLLSLNRTMCPAHPCTPFLITCMMSFTPV